MKVIMLRRYRLGKTSCNSIVNLSQHISEVVRNDKHYDFNGTDMVIRWGCTSNIPVQNVLNTSKAIHTVNNKLEFRKILNEHELCPKTWFDVNDDITYPVVVRPGYHAQGRHLYVVNSKQELVQICHKLGGNNYYISELINKVSEFRVCVVQGRVAWVAKKTPGNPQDIAWNVARGGRFDNVRWDDWPLKAVRISIEAFNLSGLDFGGVDIMIDNDNNCYILEINSAPSLTSAYRQDCMAKCFDWIITNNKNKIQLTNARGNYRKFIHPALCDNAILA